MKAWQLIEKEENWWAGFNDPINDPVLAKKLCAGMAIAQACRLNHKDDLVDMHTVIELKFNKLKEHVNSPTVSDWNDTHTHAEVLAVLKELDI